MSNRRKRTSPGRYPTNHHSQIQALESRTLLTATLLSDINSAPEMEGGSPFRLTASGDFLYFTASTATTGTELWKTDGTEAGTTLVKDIAPGAESSRIVQMVDLDGQLFFHDANHSGRIWTTNGTDSGTEPFFEGASIQFPLTEAGGSLFFNDYDGLHTLYISNGSQAGTFQLGNFGHVREVIAIGDVFYFAADGDAGSGLWKTDGTSAGTLFVKEFEASGNFPGLENLAEFDGKLFFSGDDGSFHGRELWTSDGTESGTVLLKDLVSAGNGYPKEFTVVNDLLYFSGASRLWRSNGTSAGTYIVSTDLSSPFHLTDLNGTLVMRANGAGGTELWKSNGTQTGTVRVADINPFGSSTPRDLSVLNDQLVFFAYDGRVGRQYVSDGTAAGTVPLGNIELRNVDSPTVWEDKLYFRAEAEQGKELWITDGTDEGFTQIDIRSGTGDSDVREITAVNDSLFFVARDEEGWGLWTSNGTINNARKLTESFGQNLTNVAGTVFFSEGNSLWKSDGTVSGTKLVKELGGNPDEFYANGNTLYFRGSDGVSGRELWKSDGTAAGTVMVKDIAHGDAASNPRRMTDINGTLYFDAFHPSYGFELWKSDGTEAGTVLVKNIQTSLHHAVPDFLTPIGDSFYFSAIQGAQRGLWKSDGSEAGTVLVKDMGPTNDTYLREFVIVDDHLFFVATSPEGDGLWKSDGSTEGTMRVAEFANGTTSAPANLVNVNGVLFFTADDGESGREVWMSDGTTSGTVLAADLNAGPASSNPTALVNSYGTLYFSASNGITGQELWRTDGTTEGTTLVANIAAVGDSTPEQVTQFRNTVVFTANSEQFGNEIWTVTNESADGNPPLATVMSLPGETQTRQIDVHVEHSDIAGFGPVSGVDTWDLFAAIDDGAWTRIESELPASQTSVTVTVESHLRYWFRAVARDNAGNVEFDAFLSEATTVVGDVAPPDTTSNSATSNNDGLVTLQLTGTDAGNSGLDKFEVLVSIDGEALTPVSPAPIPAGSPIDDVYAATLEYQAIRDNTAHSYEFFVVGIDGAGNRENIPETPDATLSVTAAPADPLAATGIDIQQQTTQRSFVQFADVVFNDTSGLMDLISNNRIAVERFALDDATPDIGTGSVVTGFSAAANGNSIRLNFGTDGLGGVGHLGNGFYRILLDMDDDGIAGDAHFEFFRLYGDANGDGKVDRNDRRVSEDLTGDGMISSADRRLYRYEARRGDSLLDELFELLDD